MQLMPGTAAELGVTDSFRADENINGGTAYLDALLLRYHDHLALALAAYNAGPAAVDKYHGVPPYRETQVYVARVIREFNRRKQWEKQHPAAHRRSLLHATQPLTNGSESQVKKHSWIMYLVGAILLGALVWLVHTRVHFQWSVFRDELQHVDWRRIILGIAMMVFCYWLRAVRWAVLIRPQKKVSSFSLLGSQVIGFTAVALFGRLADLVRPYLVAKRTRLPLSSQIAVYTVERMFDLGAMALIFSSALLLAPDRATLPHHEALQHAALGGLVVAVALAIFAVVVRASGRAVAGLAERALGSVSPSLGHR